MNDSIPPKTPSSASSVAGFCTNAAAPAINAGCSSSIPETMCTGMCRVAGWRLSRSSTVQPSSTGRLMSSTIASGRNSRASAGRCRHAARRVLEAPLAGDLELGAGEVGVVLDDQDDAVAVLDRLAVVVDLARSRAGSDRARLVAVVARRGRGRARRDGVEQLGRRRRRRGLDVLLRQEERERASLARLGLDVDLAAEQPRDLPADREAEPGSAVAAARRPVRLLERLEDQAQLVVRIPTPVSTTEKPITRSAFASTSPANCRPTAWLTRRTTPPTR